MKAIYWLSMCTDYDPKQLECYLILMNLYVTLGQLQPALIELDIALKLEKPNRAMLTYYRQYDCDLPRMAVELLSLKARQQNTLDVDESMYLVMLVYTSTMIVLILIALTYND